MHSWTRCHWLLSVPYLGPRVRGPTMLYLKDIKHWRRSATGHVWLDKNNVMNQTFCCADCEILQPNMFMIHDELWTWEPSLILCIPCTQRRLGRPLTVADLKVCVPINFFYYIHGIDPNRDLLRTVKHVEFERYANRLFVRGQKDALAGVKARCYKKITDQFFYAIGRQSIQLV